MLNKKLIYKIAELSWMKKCSLYNRLTRNGIHNILPLSKNRIIVVIKNYILTIDNNRLINKHEIKYGSRPIRSGICVLQNNDAIYGDYSNNPDREPVHLYISEDKGESWEILWKSRPGFARHIHFVCPDLNNKEWVYFGTGDYDNEPGIYKLNIKTKKIEIIGEGDQKWRAVDLIQSDNKLIWGTDCEYDQNYIYSYNLPNGPLTRITKIPGPAYYSTRDKSGNLYIGTTIEDRKKHKACILKSNDGQNWEKIKEFKKDMWHSKLFGYGVIEFINGQEKLDDLIINSRGLK